MKRILVMMGFVLLLAGCNAKNGKELTVAEVDIGKAPKEVQQFIEGVQADEGTFLYLDGKKNMYVYLNSGMVEQDSETAHYDNVQVSGDDETLTFTYDKLSTEDLNDESLKYKALYKVEKDKDYNTVTSMENGKEHGFDVVSGNAK